MPVDLWVVEVHHTHSACTSPFAGREQHNDDCEYLECPGLGWNLMSEIWWHPPQKSYDAPAEKRNMTPRPLEDCVARCYTQRGFLSRHSSKGTPYRIRNLETDEVIPVER